MKAKFWSELIGTAFLLMIVVGSGIIPVYGPRLGDDDPVVIFRNRLNGLISYDPFDRKSKEVAGR